MMCQTAGGREPSEALSIGTFLRPREKEQSLSVAEQQPIGTPRPGQTEMREEMKGGGIHWGKVGTISNSHSRTTTKKWRAKIIEWHFEGYCINEKPTVLEI